MQSDERDELMARLSMKSGYSGKDWVRPPFDRDWPLFCWLVKQFTCEDKPVYFVFEDNSVIAYNVRVGGPIKAMHGCKPEGMLLAACRILDEQCEVNK